MLYTGAEWQDKMALSREVACDDVSMLGEPSGTKWDGLQDKWLSSKVTPSMLIARVPRARLVYPMEAAAPHEPRPSLRGATRVLPTALGPAPARICPFGPKSSWQKAREGLAPSPMQPQPQTSDAHSENARFLCPRWGSSVVSLSAPLHSRAPGA